MNNEDYLLNDFFKEMKDKDAQVPVPPFNKSTKKHGVLNVWLAVAAAINILLFIGALWQISSPNESASMAQRSIQTIEDDGEDLMDWNTPTDDLLSNF